MALWKILWPWGRDRGLGEETVALVEETVALLKTYCSVRKTIIHNTNNLIIIGSILYHLIDALLS